MEYGRASETFVRVHKHDQDTFSHLKKNIYCKWAELVLGCIWNNISGIRSSNKCEMHFNFKFKNI